MNHRTLVQKWSFMEKLCSVHGGITTEWFILNFKTRIRHSIQIYSLNSCKTPGTRQAEKRYVSAPENAIPHSARITPEKYWISNGLFYPIHHVHQTLQQAINNFSVLYKSLWMKKKFSRRSIEIVRRKRLRSKQVEFY